MRIIVAAIGRLKKGSEKDLATRYAERAGKTGRPVGISDIGTAEFAESRADSVNKRKEEEARLLLSRIPERACIIAFDERGNTPTSREFAALIQRNLDSGVQSLGLMIGGPDGLAPELRNEAHEVVSFGKLTLPHQLVRVMVFEQLYRATTILTGHPYHRD